MNKKLWRYLGPLTALSLLGLALWILDRELGSVRFPEIMTSLKELSPFQLLLALLLTALNYLVLTGYDALAFRYLGKSLAYGKVALASFIGYAFSNNAGFSAIAGSGVRYRLYSAWGFTALDVARVVAFYSVTFWVGLFALGGGVFIFDPLSIPAKLHSPFSTTLPLGVILLAALGLFLLATLLREKPFVIFGREFSLPPFRLALVQTVLSSADWALAAAVLYVLLPADAHVRFGMFLGAFLLGQFAGVISHVPGGLGVFEGILMALLSGAVPSSGLFASLLAYRAIYYLLPLAISIILLGASELFRQKAHVQRAARFFAGWVPEVAPRVLALMTFVAGAILLFSGATPADSPRLTIIKHTLALPVVEISHFLGSLLGAALLLLAMGLQRRLDAAYLLTGLSLVAGIVVSLLKGLDWEEALFLSVLLCALLPSRRYFYRRSSLLSPSFSPEWITAILLVLVCSTWLGLFSFQHVEYRHDLWWSFAFRGEGEASRFLRAFVGSAAFLLLFALARLLRPAPARSRPLSPEEIERAAAVVSQSPSTVPSLALLGDKSLLFSESGKSFVMYGVEGRSWVAMGDPAGPAEERPEIAWCFLEEVDRHGGWCIFYEVGTHNLPLYLDLGLTLLKTGEEARVPLETFSLEGSGRKSMRNIVNKIEKEGWEFVIVPKEEIPSILPSLEAVSDAWLAEKSTREKGFSLGYFDPEYLSRCPAALIRRDGRIAAFANILEGNGRDELSVDLMRYGPEAPPGTMDFLFIRLMLMGKERGYQWFNLGVAPLSGLEARTLAPLWNRFGAFLYRSGEHFYNFKGVRQYKDKFDPVWEPRYIACPGGLSLAPILSNIASLISGGVKGVISK
jgi:phosphatidylglycerol lysyltransferase